MSINIYLPNKTIFSYISWMEKHSKKVIFIQQRRFNYSWKLLHLNGTELVSDHELRDDVSSCSISNSIKHNFIFTSSSHTRNNITETYQHISKLTDNYIYMLALYLIWHINTIYVDFTLRIIFNKFNIHLKPNILIYNFK